MGMARFWRHEDGSVAVLVAAAIVVAVGLAAFTVDLSNAYSTQGRLQNAADAAALAAVQKLPGEVDEARQLALQFASSNVNAVDGDVTTAADVTFGQYDRATQVFAENVEPYNAVRVVARRLAENGNAVQTYFGGIFNVASIDIEAEAIAVIHEVRPCVYALDPDASQAFHVQGSPSVQVLNCGIHVNSNAEDAITTQGNPSVTAERICTAGGYVSRRGLNPLPETDCEPKADPLTYLPEPTPPSACFLENVVIETPLILPPNVKLCGTVEVASGGRLTVAGGIVFLEDGHLHVKGTGTIDATDAMLFLDESSTFEFKSAHSLSWSAPTSGPWAGIAIFQSRAGSEMRTSRIGSSRDVFITGSIYAPNMDLELGGSALLSIDQARHLVVNKLRLQGSPDIVLNMLRSQTRTAALVK